MLRQAQRNCLGGGLQIGLGRFAGCRPIQVFGGIVFFPVRLLSRFAGELWNRFHNRFRRGYRDGSSLLGHKSRAPFGANLWLKFTDDLELALDTSARVIHVRSASRIGRGDLGVNRKRVEAIRAAMAGGSPQ